MNAQVYVMPAVLMLAFGAYAIWMMTKSKKALAGMGPAMEGFFQRSGYRYADMPPEPLASHVQRAVAEIQNHQYNRETAYVRGFHGLPIHFVQGGHVNPDGGYAFWSRWSAPLSSPPRILFHIADKSLAGVGKAIREAFSNMTREWSPMYPHQVTTGIPQIDGRFVVYANDPNAVAWMFQQNPALVAALLQCTEVDLWLEPGRASFTDPMQKNITAALGGTVGQMAIGFDYAKRMDMSLPVHDRVAEVLAMAVRAAQ